jgi:hypothetical protein
MTILVLYHGNVTPFMSQQYHSFYVTTVSLLLRHDNVTPFYITTIYSLVGRFFLVLIEVSPANYSFRKPIVGQNHLLLFWSPAASLVCHWSVDQVSGRGLLLESWLLRHLKGLFYQWDRERERDSAIVTVKWPLSGLVRGWVCRQEGELRRKTADWMEEGDVMSCGSPHSSL